jgi:aspartate dehydrogenase
MTQAKRQPLDVALGGFGAVGKRVARSLDEGMPGLRLVAVSARDIERAARETAALATPVPVLRLEELAGVADVVVECAPAELLETVAVPVLEAGKTLIVISAGALIAADHLIDLAAAHGGRIIVPSGALLGLDAVTGAAEGTIRSVRMITRKPVEGLVGAPHVVEQGIDLENLEAPLRLFQGSAREAAKGFPANLNVAAALGLAGLGADRTEVEIWADPGVTRNTHSIEVTSDSADFTMTIENIPSEENPRTGKITALSVVAALRKLTSPLRMGT